jgi:hypothetical protein
MIFNKLYSEPLVLYPPSSVDANPAAAVRAALAAPAEGGVGPALRPAVAALLAAREWLAPSGSPATFLQIMVYTAVAIVLTYAAAYILLHAFENPVRRLVTGAWLGGPVRTLVWWYSLALILLGLVVHVVGIAANLWYVRPELETHFIAEFEAKRAAAAIVP